jgi:hypothetical protein
MSIEDEDGIDLDRKQFAPGKKAEISRKRRNEMGCIEGDEHTEDSQGIDEMILQSIVGKLVIRIEPILRMTLNILMIIQVSSEPLMWPHAFQELPIDYSAQFFLVNCQMNILSLLSASIDISAGKTRGRCRCIFLTVKARGCFEPSSV